MTLAIDLLPEMERQLQEAAAGRDPADSARVAAAEKIAALQARGEGQRQIAMLERWNAEDAKRADDQPAPTIPRLSLREPEKEVTG